MDYFRPPFLINRPPLFQPRMEHFNLMHGPGPFHPSMSPFAMTTPSALSLYLQRPPLPPPPSLHLPMLGAGAYMHSHNQHQPRDPRRQRPSKRVRQRMRRLSQRGEHGDESRDGNSESIPIASESGYDTAGDCLTPATPLDSPTVASGQREFPIDSKKQPEGTIIGHRSQSSDSSSSMDLSETSLKKLLKDLHRCDVSISKYQGMLDKNCEDGLRNLQEMFSRLHDHLNVREQDLTKELNSTREKAASILLHRQSTSSSLRQAAENDEVMLNETQILELKHQIKCFVTDRKVDEEIGTATYFKADSDDLIKHIMGFGKVIGVRHQYTVWDENPLGMINKSRNQEFFPPPTQEDNGEATQSLQESEVVQLESASKSQPAESASDSPNTNRQPDNCFIHDQTESVTSPTCNDSESSLETGDLSAPPRDTKSPTSPHSAPLQPISSQISQQPSPARSNSKQAASSTNRHTYSYRVSATSSVKYVPKSPFSIKSGRPWHAVSKVTAKRAPTLIKHKDYSAPKPVETMKNKKVEKEKLEQQKENNLGSSLPEKEECTVGSTEESGVSPRSKYSRSELQTIQLRIKDSLRQQGVYLYDPVTGDGPLSPTSTPGASRCSTSSIDISGERGKTSDQNNTAIRKKKTPTQLRRERKKRQKERERRQRELEKRSEDQLKEQTEDKDSETETKVTLTGDHSKQSDDEDYISPQPASPAAETTTLGEGDMKTATTTDHHSTLADKLSSSDSERQPESSSNNSQDHSPTHSTSSTERTLDNNVPVGEDPEVAHVNPQCCHGLRETNESETTEEDTVFIEVTSTADRSLQQNGVNRERSPSLVVLTEETASEVKTNLKVCHSATKPKTDVSVLPTCVNRDSEADGGTKNENELELKPEE